MSVSFHEPAVNAAFEKFKRFAVIRQCGNGFGQGNGFWKSRTLILTASMDESEARGITRGETRGRAFGLTERSVEIAKIMKAEGPPAALIARMTGLSIEEIKRLR